MGYDGAGSYTRSRNFSADASAKIRILASAMDQELDDFASAMGLALLRDGQAAATGDIPMGGNRLTNVGGPASASNYTRASELISNVPIYMVDAEASADRISVSAQYFTTASAGLAPAGGTGVIIKMGSDKSSAPVLYLNTGDGNPHSGNVFMNYSVSAQLYSGALRSGGIYEFIFSSAESVWKLMNPTVKLATTDTPGVIEIATTAEVDTGTDTRRAVTPSTFNAYLGVATTASAGRIEIATTAETTAGTDTSRAVTPAGLAPVYAQISVLSVDSRIVVSAAPYVGTFVVSNVSTDISVVALNYRASAAGFTISSAGAGSWRIGFGGSDLLTSARGGVPILQAQDTQNNTLVARASLGLSTYQFQLTSGSGGGFNSSANVFFTLHKIT